MRVFGVFHVGDVIRKLRNQAGWSIEDLAQKAGVNKGTISTIERGDALNFRQETIAKIAKALGTSATEIFIEVADVRRRRERGDTLQLMRDRIDRELEAGRITPEQAAGMLPPQQEKAFREAQIIDEEAQRAAVFPLLLRCFHLNDAGIERLVEEAELLAHVERYQRRDGRGQPAAKKGT
jgi:transcriptional regulator with XRE-family HTH domain